MLDRCRDGSWDYWYQVRMRAGSNLDYVSICQTSLRRLELLSAYA